MTKKLFGKITTLLMLLVMSVEAFGQGYTPIRGWVWKQNLSMEAEFVLPATTAA
ncbi:hypothetical protein [Chryseobacterium wanjuense]